MHLNFSILTNAKLRDLLNLFMEIWCWTDTKYCLTHNSIQCKNIIGGMTTSGLWVKTMYFSELNWNFCSGAFIPQECWYLPYTLVLPRQVCFEHAKTQTEQFICLEYSSFFVQGAWWIYTLLTSVLWPCRDKAINKWHLLGLTANSQC